MKLTNAMRDQFVSKVMTSIKWKSPWNKDKIIDEINKRLRAVVPAEILAFDEKYPNMLQAESINVEFMNYKDKWENGNSYWVYCNAVAIKGVGLKDIFLEDLKSAWASYRAEVESRKQMRERLMEIAREMTTDDQLAAALPKLKKFIPKPAVKVVKGLPVAMTGIQNELIKMGLSA